MKIHLTHMQVWGLGATLCQILSAVDCAAILHKISLALSFDMISCGASQKTLPTTSREETPDMNRAGKLGVRLGRRRIHIANSYLVKETTAKTNLGGHKVMQFKQ